MSDMQLPSTWPHLAELAGLEQYCALRVRGCHPLVILYASYQWTHAIMEVSDE